MFPIWINYIYLYELWKFMCFYKMIFSNKFDLFQTTIIFLYHFYLCRLTQDSQGKGSSDQGEVVGHNRSADSFANVNKP